jgi:hypothetical protein
MDTTLDYEARGADGEVTHTTRVSWLGVPLLGSVERIHLHADGVTGTMDGDEWMAPWPFPVARPPGPLTVHADAHGADYDLRWLGGALRQETRSAEAGQLTLVQTTAWSRAEVDLRRRPGLGSGG